MSNVPIAFNVMLVRNTLFPLLRLALDPTAEAPDFSALTGAEWEALVNLSFEQGVAAIAVDGLQSLYDRQPELELALDSPELEGLKYEWFGLTFQAEEDYHRQVEALLKLREEIPEDLVVLKGLAVARKYPVPSHRACVDLDVFEPEGMLKQVQHDVIRENAIRDDYKHTGFQYQGVMVEYHKSLIGWKSLKNGKHIERTLRESLGTPDGIYPNDYFTALFLTVHSYTHFMLEDGISLKHICDWWMVGIRTLPEPEQQWLLEAVESFGMREFVESMTRVAEYVCNDPSTALTKADLRMLDDILALGRKKRFKSGHLNMAYNILFRNGWKFRAFAHESNLGCLIRCGWNAVFKR